MLLALWPAILRLWDAPGDSVVFIPSKDTLGIVRAAKLQAKLGRVGAFVLQTGGFAEILPAPPLHIEKGGVFAAADAQIHIAKKYLSATSGLFSGAASGVGAAFAARGNFVSAPVTGGGGAFIRAESVRTIPAYGRGSAAGIKNMSDAEVLFIYTQRRKRRNNLLNS